MKKMIMAAALVCAAAIANAGTISWKSGNLYIASSAEGGWDNSATTQLVGKQGIVAYVAAILVDQETYNGLQGKSQADIWEAYGNAEDISALSGVKVATTGTTNNATPQTNADANTTYYAVVLAAYHDATYNKDMYIATTATATAGATGAGSAANIISNVGAAQGWQTATAPIPEPSSGILLILGMAGLALRRRRA